MMEADALFSVGFTFGEQQRELQVPQRTTLSELLELLAINFEFDNTQAERLRLAHDPRGLQLADNDAGAFTLSNIKHLYLVDLDATAAGPTAFVAACVPDYDAILSGGSCHDFLSAVSELVDNSFEAIGAGDGTVWIDLVEMDVAQLDCKPAPDAARQLERVLVVRDDGPGMDDAGLNGFLKLASHRPGERHCGFGQFGVGAKKAAFHLGEAVFVRTRAGGGDVYTGKVSRPALEKERARTGACSWLFPRGAQKARPDDPPHFTEIYVYGLREAYRGVDLRAMVPALSRKYHYVLHGPEGRPAPAPAVDVDLELNELQGDGSPGPAHPALAPVEAPAGPLAAPAPPPAAPASLPAPGKENAAPASLKRGRAHSASPLAKRRRSERLSMRATDASPAPPGPVGPEAVAAGRDALIPARARRPASRPAPADRGARGRRAELVVAGKSVRAYADDDEARLLRDGRELKTLAEGPSQPHCRIVLRYYPHTEGGETMPAPRPYGTFEAPPDGDLRSRYPGLQVFWMGRLLSDAGKDVWRLSELLKGVPAETRPVSPAPPARPAPPAPPRPAPPRPPDRPTPPGRQFLDRIKGAVFLGKAFGAGGEGRQVGVDDAKRQLTSAAAEQLRKILGLRDNARAIAEFAQRSHGKLDEETTFGEALGEYKGGEGTCFRSVRIAGPRGRVEIALHACVRATLGTHKRNAVCTVEAIYQRKKDAKAFVRLYVVESKTKLRRPKTPAELAAREAEAEAAPASRVTGALTEAEAEKEARAPPPPSSSGTRRRRGADVDRQLARAGALSLKAVQNSAGTNASELQGETVPVRLASIAVVHQKNGKDYQSGPLIRGKAVTMRLRFPSAEGEGGRKEATAVCERPGRHGRYEFQLERLLGTALLTRAGPYTFAFTSEAFEEGTPEQVLRMTLRPRAMARLACRPPPRPARMGCPLPPLLVVCEDEHGNEVAEALGEPAAPLLRLGAVEFEELAGEGGRRRAAARLRGLQAAGRRLGEGEEPRQVCTLAVSLGTYTARVPIAVLPGRVRTLALRNVAEEPLRAKADLPLPPVFVRALDLWGNAVAGPEGALVRVRAAGECVGAPVEAPVDSEGDARFDGPTAIRVRASPAPSPPPLACAEAAGQVVAPEGAAALHGATVLFSAVEEGEAEGGAGVRRRRRRGRSSGCSSSCRSGRRACGCGRGRGGGVRGEVEGGPCVACEAGAVLRECAVEVLDAAGRLHAGYEALLTASCAALPAGREVWRRDVGVLAGEGLFDVPLEPRAGLYALTVAALRAPGAGGAGRSRRGCSSACAPGRRGAPHPAPLPPPGPAPPDPAPPRPRRPPPGCELRHWFDSATGRFRISGAAAAGAWGPSGYGPAPRPPPLPPRPERPPAPGEAPAGAELELVPAMVTVVNRSILPPLRFAVEDAFGHRCEAYAGEIGLELPPGFALHSAASAPRRPRKLRAAAAWPEAAGGASQGDQLAAAPATTRRPAARGSVTFEGPAWRPPGAYLLRARDPAGALEVRPPPPLARLCVRGERLEAGARAQGGEVSLAVLPSDHPREARLRSEPPLEGRPAELPAASTLSCLRAAFEAEDGSALEPETLELALLGPGPAPAPAALRLAFEWDGAGREARLAPLELPPAAGEYTLRLTAAFARSAACLGSDAEGPLDRPSAAPASRSPSASPRAPPPASPCRRASSSRPSRRRRPRRPRPTPEHPGAPPLAGPREARLEGGVARFGAVSVGPGAPPAPTASSSGATACSRRSSRCASSARSPPAPALRAPGASLAPRAAAAVGDAGPHGGAAEGAGGAGGAGGGAARGGGGAGGAGAGGAELLRETESAVEQARAAARAAGYGEVDEPGADVEALAREAEQLLEATRRARRRETSVGRSPAARALHEAAAARDGAGRGLLGVVAALGYVRDGELAAGLQRLLGARLEAAVVRDAPPSPSGPPPPPPPPARPPRRPASCYDAFPGFIDLAANRIVPVEEGLRASLFFPLTQGALLFDTLEQALACRAARARQGRAVPPALALRERRLRRPLREIPARLDPLCVRAFAGRDRLAALAALLRARAERAEEAEAARQAAAGAEEDARLEAASLLAQIAALDEKIAHSMQAQAALAGRPS
eukprot:tig00000237_g20465.t1